MAKHSYFNFIRDVLEKKCIKNNQDIVFDYKKWDEKDTICEIDAIAWNGFEKTEGVVVFKFYYKTINSTNDILTYFNRIRRFPELRRATLVVIVYGKANVSIIDEDIQIWDDDKLSHWKEDYAIEFFNYMQFYKGESGVSKKTNKYEQKITKYHFEDNNDIYIKLLSNAIKKNNPLALVLGAGVSMEVGAMSWDKMLDKMQKETKLMGYVNDPISLAEKVGGTSLTTAQVCKDTFKNERKFLWSVHESLYTKQFSLDKNTELYQISELAHRCMKNRNFKIITYNYDDYLERYLDELGISYKTVSSQKEEYLSGNNRKTINYDMDGRLENQFAVYHVHGFLPRSKSITNMRGSICLTEADYNILYNQPYSWPIVCQMNAFRENTCLFIGCGLKDPNIRRLLELSNEEKHWHFAILCKEKMTEKDLAIVNAHFYRMGIKIIWVNDYDEIKTVLNKIQ